MIVFFGGGGNTSFPAAERVTAAEQVLLLSGLAHLKAAVDPLVNGGILAAERVMAAADERVLATTKAEAVGA